MRSSKIQVKDVLRAPGQGLLTVSTGGSVEVLKDIYNESQFLDWKADLKKRLLAFSKNPPLYFILGIPSDSGGGICRGAAHGPAHLRAAFYLKHPEAKNFDLGDVPCIPQLLCDSMLSAKQLRQSRKDLWGSEKVSLPVSPLDIAEWAYIAIRKQFPQTPIFVLGGDHSVSFPCLRALSKLKLDKGLGVLHLDAHTDLLERRFGVDVCFGTWTAQILKNFPQSKAWVQVGIRRSRHDKKYWEKKYKISQYWSKELESKDPYDFAKDLIAHWKKLKIERIYVTNDIDATDSKWVSATGTPEEDGLEPQWIAALIKELSGNFKLEGADLVEVAPVLGSEESIRKTLDTACLYWEALKWQ
jgi:agmatinase